MCTMLAYYSVILQVFKETRPIVMSCVDGYNVCIVAYGQTSTGKTYTMMGPADNPGVNVRALRELFDICKSRDNVKYRLTVRPCGGC